MKTKGTKHALLVIDMQYDFCNGGSLQVSDNPDAIIPYINSLIESDKFDLIVFSQDWHPKTHKSFACNHDSKNVFDVIQLNGIDQVMWPDHCVQNSHGAEFHKDVLSGKADKIIQKGMNIEIDSYSAFKDNCSQAETELREYLESKNIGEVTVVGLALDYCVKATCEDAIANGLKVNLHLKGTAAVAPETGEQAIDDLKQLNATIVT